MLDVPNAPYIHNVWYDQHLNNFSEINKKYSYICFSITVSTKKEIKQANEIGLYE